MPKILYADSSSKKILSGNNLSTICFGIEETPTLMKFPGICLSKEFLELEADVEERAYGIEAVGRILAHRPEDRWISLTLTTDLNTLCD